MSCETGDTVMGIYLAFVFATLAFFGGLLVGDCMGNREGRVAEKCAVMGGVMISDKCVKELEK